jgi:purine-nucleoside phosphorylase
VKTIIRVGSAGSMHKDLNIGDLVLAMGACHNSNYGEQYLLPGHYAPIADFDLLRAAAAVADEKGYKYKVGNVFSSDIFYSENPATEQWQKMGVLAVEMEAPSLYMNAARCGARALCMCTISDSLVTGEVTTAEERQNSFTKMMDVAFSIV